MIKNRDVPSRHVLLTPNVLVYCDEDVKVPFSQGQQRPILLAAESRVSNGLTFMTAVSKQEFDLPGDTLIAAVILREEARSRVYRQALSPASRVQAFLRLATASDSRGGEKTNLVPGARLACNSHPIIPAIPFEIEVAA